MNKSVSETLKDAGRAISDAAQDAGEAIADGTRSAVQNVKEMAGQTTEGSDVGVAGIREHMKVIASCGTTVGVVDGVEGSSIKLTRKDSLDGQHHFVPVTWVDHVDTHVHLTRNSVDTQKSWQSDSSSGCCSH